MIFRMQKGSNYSRNYATTYATTYGTTVKRSIPKRKAASMPSLPPLDFQR